MDVEALVKEREEELIALRRDFHKHPELGFEEFRTQRVIKRYLEDCGLKVQEMATTGVVALLEGENPGPTLLMRADMDALPMEEENDVEYKSTYPGKMHSCAHDGHMAMLLVAAKILSRHKERLQGNIKFVFQPNEEDAGAKFMVREGVLENPKVDACMAVHLWAPIEQGKISVQEGPVMGAHENFKVEVKGKGGHSSSPQDAVDPIMIACHIVNAAQSIESKQISALKPTVINFSKINAGTAPNIIPESVTMEGTLRYLYPGGPETAERPRQRMEKIIKGVCSTFDASYDMEFVPCNFPVVNDQTMASLVKREAEKLVGEKNVIPYVTMAGEDFSEFTTGIPSVFYFVGTGNKEKGLDYPHHHPRFDIDEGALVTGTKMHLYTALAFLKEHSALREELLKSVERV